MTFTKGAKLLSHLTALACFSALITNDQFAWTWSVAGLGLILASLYFVVTERPAAISSFFWRGASVLFCLIFLIDLRFSGALLAACMHFLVYLMAYRLFHLGKSRDHLQLYLICFLQLLASAGAGSGFGYAPSFIVSAALLIWGLVVQHLKREEESCEPANPARSFRSVIPLQFMMSIHLLSVGVLLPTLLIFFLLPRMGVGVFQREQTASQKISGFSEKVDLGSMGPVKRDFTRVMRVLPVEKEKGPLYLRGMSFDAYDGRTWRNTLSRRVSLPRVSFDAYDGRTWRNTLSRRVSLPRSFDRTFEIGSGRIGSGRSMRNAGNALQRTILLEPLETPVLFTVGSPVVVRGGFPSLLVDLSGTLYLTAPPLQRTEYEVTALPELPPEADREAQQIAYPFDIQEHYLFAPVSPRISALAHTIADPFPTVYQKARAIERHLRTEYAYSLDVSPSTRPPLEEFLFFQKRGYCEYYASAMVMMLRSVGIASRLVTGFLPGEWNEFGKYYLVRQSDAHAWVEIYFPDGRWLTFDPTPSGDPAEGARSVGAYLDWMRLKVGAASAYVDWVRFKWDRYIVHYSLRDQFALLEGTRDQADRFSNGIGEVIVILKRWVRRISARFSLAVAAAIGLMLFFYRSARWKRPGRTASKQRATLLYERMLRLLSKRGLKKPQEQTPLEFVEMIAQKGDRSIDAIRRLTDHYYRARFGGETFSSDEVREAEQLFSEIKARH